MEHVRVDDNIRLETVKISMAPVIFDAINKNREFLSVWLPFIDYTMRVTDTEKFLKSIAGQKFKKKDETFSIWYKEEFAGLIGFKDTDWVNRKTELGYWIIEKMQGKGIITSCIKELAKYAFRKLQFNRIQIKVAVGNSKSAAVPQRLGFEYEGTEREGEYHKRGYFDLDVYSMLKSDWTKTN
jgi:ribosomal-protein-serine acetyltransferase